MYRKLLFLALATNIFSADIPDRDPIRDSIFSVVYKIMTKSRAKDCTFELCSNAQVIPLFKSKSGYGVIMKGGVPARIVTPQGIALLVDLQRGIFDDISTTEQFFDMLGLMSYRQKVIPLGEDEALYGVTLCDAGKAPPFSMK